MQKINYTYGICLLIFPAPFYPTTVAWIFQHLSGSNLLKLIWLRFWMAWGMLGDVGSLQDHQDHHISEQTTESVSTNFPSGTANKWLSLSWVITNLTQVKRVLLATSIKFRQFSVESIWLAIGHISVRTFLHFHAVRSCFPFTPGSFVSASSYQVS